MKRAALPGPSLGFGGRLHYHKSEAAKSGMPFQKTPLFWGPTATAALAKGDLSRVLGRGTADLNCRMGSEGFALE